MPGHQVVVQPNNDTLYTSSHLDLRSGALVLHVPAVPHHRCYSFEFLDPYTNVFATSAPARPAAAPGTS